MRHAFLVLLVASVTRALAADVGSFDARQARARLLLAQHDFGRALHEAEALNHERPDEVSGYQLLAAADLGLGEYGKAEEALQWMFDLRIGKADAAGWLLLSRFREATGDLDGALEAVNSGFADLDVARQSEGRALMITAARLFRLSHRFRLAEQALERVAGDDAEMSEEYALLRLAQVGRRNEAIALLRRAASLNPHPRVLYRLALATSAPDDAAAFERAARERMDSFDNGNRELVLHLVTTARVDEALRIARREAGRRHDTATMDALAVALFAAGHAGEARSVMKDVLAVGTRDPDILKHASTLGVDVE